MNLLSKHIVLACCAALSLAYFSSCKNTFSDDLPLPEIYNPSVFVASNNKIVYSVDVATGETNWKHSVDGEVHATPVLHRNALWIGTTEGTLYRLDYKNGDEVETRTFPGPITGTPLIYESGLIVVAGTKVFYVNPDDLAQDFWSYDIGGEINASPATHRIAGGAENAIFIAAENNILVALNPQGEVIWQYSPSDDGGFYSSPCVTNDSVLYIGNDNGRLYAIYTTDGSERWSFETQGQIRSSPIHIGGNVLVGSNDRHLYSVDSATGLLRWKIQTADQIVSSPAVFNQYVYFGSYDQYFYCVDIIQGEVEWKIPTFGLIKASPMIHDGYVYIGSFDKNLYKLDVRNGKQDWVKNIQGTMECSPILDTVGGAVVPSISGNYRY